MNRFAASAIAPQHSMAGSLYKEDRSWRAMAGSAGRDAHGVQQSGRAGSGSGSEPSHSLGYQSLEQSCRDE